jgi:DNA-binding response OmpR family regulator
MLLMPVEDPSVTYTPGCYKSALLVDDEPIVADYCRVVLEKCGFCMDIASNGAQATRMITVKHYDLIIVDVCMPLMDGLSLYRYIKIFHPRLMDNTCFISGDVLSRDTIEFLASCGRPFLNKPFSPQELMDKTEAIRKHRHKELRYFLVIDDSPDICDLVRIALEDERHVVLSTASGTVALELMDGTRFDHIFLDLKMPIMKGDEE